MGFFFVSITLIFQNLLSFHFIKDMLLFVFSYLPPLGKSHVHIQDFDVYSEEYHRPSPLLVPVPVPTHCLVECMKEQLQVVEYSLLLKKSEAPRQDDGQCDVCFNRIGESQEVRELGNCCHVFHKECIDIWMDQGQGTCPLCRSKLSPADQGEELKCGGRGWFICLVKIMWWVMMHFDQFFFLLPSMNCYVYLMKAPLFLELSPVWRRNWLNREI